ncbi:MAG: hypothetical protein Fur0026_10450 [Sideroxydans sp.]
MPLFRSVVLHETPHAVHLLLGLLWLPTLAVFLWLSGSGFALAEEIAYSESIFFEELPVVLTASRLRQPLADAPNAVTVIDREMIEASGFRQVADLFRLVPGMYVGFVSANSPIVSLNGVSDQYSRRMQVLVDGRSVYLPPFGGVDWQSLPLILEDIERIEVVRGPAAASHGTNSFYGVINIITRDAGNEKGSALSLNQGEYGIADLAATFGSMGETSDYRLSFAALRDEGDNPAQVNDGSARKVFNLRTSHRLNRDDSLDFQMGFNDGSYGQGTAGRPQEAFRDAHTQSDFQQLSWTHLTEDGDEHRLAWYRINRNFSDPYGCINSAICQGLVPGVPPAQGFSEVREINQRQDLEWQTTLQAGADNRMVWGGGVRQDRADQAWTFPAPLTLNQWRVFAHDEWRLSDAALLNLGGMYEDDGAGHRETSPRISLNYHLLPQQTLRASYSASTRNPVMVEMNMQTTGGNYWRDSHVPPANPLRPEKIVSAELGYLADLSHVGMEARIYHERVRDIILLDYGAADISNPGSPVHSFKNLVEATFRGIDLSANYRWTGGRAIFNYARQKSDCALSDYPTQYFNPVVGAAIADIYQTEYLNLCAESVPTDSGSLLLMQEMPQEFRLSAAYYFRSRVRVTDVSSGFPPESPMHRVDLRLAKRIGQKERPGGGEVALVLQNAFQDNYTGYGNVPQRANLLFKRRAYLTAIIHF